MSYDAINRLTNMVDAAGASAFGWTEHGALASEDGPWAGDTVSWGYNDARLRQGLTLVQPNATSWGQSYAYDGAWRPTNIASPAGAFAYQYALGTAASMIQKVTLPGGAYATNVFDDLGRLLSTALKQPGGAVLDSHAYLYDPASVEVAHSWLTVFLPGEATRIGGLLVVCGRFASSRNSALQFDWVPAIF